MCVSTALGFGNTVVNRYGLILKKRILRAVVLYWGNAASQETLNNAWRHFGCHSWGGKDAPPACSGQEWLLNALQGAGQLHKSRLSGPTVNSSEVEKC